MAGEDDRPAKDAAASVGEHRRDPSETTRRWLLTRRTLLGGGLSALALAPAVALAAGDDPDLAIIQESGKVVIALGSASWDVDLLAISDNTRVQISSVSADRHRVTLTTAAGGGRATAMPIRLHFERKQHSALSKRWYLSVELLLDSLTRSNEVLFAEFLDHALPRHGAPALSETPPSGARPRINLSSGAASSLVSRVTAAAVHPGRRLGLSMLPDLTWQLTSDSARLSAREFAIRFDRADLAMVVQAVRLGRVPPPHAPCVAARTAGPVPNAHVLAAVALGARSGVKSWSFGKIAAERVDVKLSGGRLHAAAERYRIDRGFGEAVQIGSRVDFFGNVRFAGDVPVNLAVQSGEMMWGRTTLPNARWKVKAALRLPDKPFVADFAMGRLELRGSDPLVIEQKTEPADRGKVDFSGTVEVTHVFRHVAGTDFSRLDVVVGTATLVPPGGRPASGGFIEIGGKASLAQVPLDTAKMSLRRSLDLLALSYRFVGIDLELSRESAGFVRANGASEALLIAELPPQHIAEEVFYRPTPPPKPASAEPAETVSGEDDIVITNVFVDEVAIRKTLEFELAQRIPELQGPDDNTIKLGQQKLDEDVGKSLPGKIMEAKLRDPDYRAFHEKFEKDYPNVDPHAPGNRGIALAVMRDLQKEEGEILPALARARSSGPTRVAFVVPPEPESSEAGTTPARAQGSAERSTPKRPTRLFAYSVDGLTDFHRFDMKVVQRAHYFGDSKPDSPTSAAAELRAYGIEADDEISEPQKRWEARMRRIRELMAAPTAHETSIELPTRLMLSPDNQAKWLTPAAPDPRRDGTQKVPLWRMQLDHDSATAPVVRAVWSPDFEPGVFGARLRPPQPGERRSYRTSMDAYDRHELVALSSMHGLPVLPRQRREGGLDGDQFAPPPRFHIDPSSATGSKEAIYRPKPLSISELTLTSLGGSISMDTAFEPPAGVDHLHRANYEMTFSVERWRHTAVLGRDVAVEIVYKGFLFPLGHRCSLVKLTERVFLKGRSGQVTAYLVQRMFLRTGRPEKTFSALHQPDEGRRWPVSKIEVVTKRTPDIVDPMNDSGTLTDGVHPSGRITTGINGESLKGLVFWPRTERRPRGNTVFQIKVDESASLIQMPLMFVNNVAAHDPATMAAVCTYYDSLSQPPLQASALQPPTDTPLVVVSHGGVARRYATEKRRDSTSYETIDWTLSAEGRASNMKPRPSVGSAGQGADIEATTPRGTNNYHEMDALMEGADQPPFFPFIKKAKIRVKQLEQLAGGAAKPVTVSYIDQYRLDGFVSTANPSEAFLALQHGAPLSFDNAGDRSGGVAKPDLTIRALSRNDGPIGQANGEPVAPGQPVGSVDLSRFKDVAPGVLFKDAKLLGLVKFSTLLEGLGGLAPPKIKQYIDYSFLEGAQEGIVTALKKVVEVIDDYITRSWKLEIDGASSSFTLKDALPDLHASMLNVSKEADAVANDLESGRTADAFQNGVELYEACQGLIAQVDRIVDDPAAPLKANAQRLLLHLQTSVLGEITAELQAKEGQFHELQQAIRNSSARLESELAAKLLPTLNDLKDEWLSRILGFPSLSYVADLEIVKRLPKRFVDVLAEKAGVAATPEGARNKGLLLAFIDTDRFPGQLRATYKTLASEVAETSPPARLFLRRLIAELDQLARDDARLPLAYDRLAGVMAKVYGLADRLSASALLKPREALDRLVVEVKTVIETYLNATQAEFLGEIRDACQRAGSALISLAIAELPVGPLSSQDALYCDITSTQPMAGPLAATCGDIRSMLGAVAAVLEQLRALRDTVRNLPADTEPKRQMVAEVEALYNTSTGGVEAIRRDLAALFAKIRDAGEAWRSINGAAGLDTIDKLENWLRVSSESICTSFQVDTFVNWIQSIPRAAADVGDAARTAIGTLREQVALINVATAKLTRPDIILAGADHVVSATRLHMQLASLLLKFSQPVAEIMTSSTATFEAIRDDAESIRALALSKAEMAIAEIHSQAAGGWLDRMFSSSIQDPRLQVLAQFRSTIDKAVADLRDLDNPLVELGGRIDRLLTQPPASMNAGLEDIRQTLTMGAAQRWERDLVRLTDIVRTDLLAVLRTTLRDISSLQQAGFDLLAQPLADVLRPGVRFAAQLYKGIESARDSVARELQAQLGVMAGVVSTDAALYIARPADGSADMLAKDRAALDSLTIEPGSNLASELQVARRVLDAAAPVVLVRQIIQAVEQILRGDIGKFVNLEQLKAQLVEGVKDLVPSKVGLDYDLEMPVKPNDQVKKVFDIWTTNGGDNGSETNPESYNKAFNERVFGDELPLQGEDKLKKTDLVVRTRTRVDILQKGKVTSTADGYLRPFKVSLFGPIDVVTMFFDGATFAGGSGSAGDLKIKLIETKLGKQVEFLEKLQDWLNGGNGTGFKLKILTNPLGIEARYGFALPIISVGTVSFSNVSLDTGVVLPFEKGEALFRVGLSSRDNPFLISAAPFGGGGHLALYADAERIVGFEASFEYGGVAAFGFGPMQGIGRLTTGFYISKDPLRGATIQGHFFVGGSARVWIFGVSASLAVRMGQANGGQMCGSAIYSYSFSYGIDDIEFQVAVWRQENKGFNSSEQKSSKLAPQRPTRYAALGRTGVISDSDGLLLAQASQPDPEAAAQAEARRLRQYGVVLESTVFARERRWDRYNAYFDSSLEPED